VCPRDRRFAYSTEERGRCSCHCRNSFHIPDVGRLVPSHAAETLFTFIALAGYGVVPRAPQVLRALYC
jgi:hypothetical protein